jgi:hypothetical protein
MKEQEENRKKGDKRKEIRPKAERKRMRGTEYERNKKEARKERKSKRIRVKKGKD